MLQVVLRAWFFIAVLCPVAGLHAASAFSDPERVDIRGYQDDAMEPFITSNGRYLLFNNSNDPSVDTNLHYAERIDGITFEYKGELRGVNTPALEGVPTMDGYGNFYFVSPRSYGATLSTIYQARFSDGDISGVVLVSGISKQKPGIVNFDVEVSPDGQYLYFVDSRFGKEGGPKTAGLVVAKRKGLGFARVKDSDKIFKRINTWALEYAPSISADGRELFFTRFDRKNPPAIYRAVRESIGAVFTEPSKVMSIEGFVEAPSLSLDGRALYYHKKVNDKFRIYRVTR